MLLLASKKTSKKNKKGSFKRASVSPPYWSVLRLRGAPVLYTKIHLKSRRFRAAKNSIARPKKLLNTQLNQSKLVTHFGITSWEIPVQSWGKNCGLINAENKTKHKKNHVQWFYFCCIFDCNYCLKYFNCLASPQVPCLWGGEAGQFIVCY